MTRRGRGEGTIFRRTDGRWMGQVDLGWVSGKRQRKSFYGPTRRVVADAISKATRAARDGSLVVDQRQTVEQFLTHWLRDVAKSRVRLRTWDSYEAAVVRHIIPHIGKIRLGALVPQHCQRWLATLSAAGVPVGRQRYARSVLRAALNTALRWRLVTQNVAQLVDAPRTERREIRPLDPHAARVLLDAAAKDPLYAFVAVGLACGLRLGESLGLRWDDVDLDTKTLHVRRALQRAGGDATVRRRLVAEARKLKAQLRSETLSEEETKAAKQRLTEIRAARQTVKTSVALVEPKSNRSRRALRLPDVVVSALKAHRTRQLEARLLAGSRWKEQGFVFTTSIGTPCDPFGISKQFKHLVESAGLPPMRIHDLRHSCATLLLAQGVSARVVMETLGHSQVSLTLNTYSHVLPTLMSDAADQMDRVFGR